MYFFCCISFIYLYVLIPLLPRRSSQGHPDDFETENLNPEDIFNSIKQTSADIQSLSISSKLEPYDDVKKKHDFPSQDSGIQDLRIDSPDGGDSKRPFFSPYSSHVSFFFSLYSIFLSCVFLLH